MEKEHISSESLTMLRLCREISQMRSPNKPPRVYYSWVWRTANRTGSALRESAFP